MTGIEKGDTNVKEKGIEIQVNENLPMPRVEATLFDSVSPSSTSSYAASISSSAFTPLYDDGSSASSSLFGGCGGQGQGNGMDDSRNGVFSIQLKQEESFVGSSMEGGDAGMNGVVALGGKEKGLIIKGKGKEMTVPYVELG